MTKRVEGETVKSLPVPTSPNYAMQMKPSKSDKSDNPNIGHSFYSEGCLVLRGSTMWRGGSGFYPLLSLCLLLLFWGLLYSLLLYYQLITLFSSTAWSFYFVLSFFGPAFQLPYLHQSSPPSPPASRLFLQSIWSGLARLCTTGQAEFPRMLLRC